MPMPHKVNEAHTPTNCEDVVRSGRVRIGFSVSPSSEQVICSSEYTVPQHGHFFMFVIGLTSRAQARGTNQREPRSGTGDAIPRCLQRFVRHHFASFLIQYKYRKYPAPNATSVNAHHSNNSAIHNAKVTLA